MWCPYWQFGYGFGYTPGVIGSVLGYARFGYFWLRKAKAQFDITPIKIRH
jgi:hypothetical protein